MIFFNFQTLFKCTPRAVLAPHTPSSTSSLVALPLPALAQIKSGDRVFQTPGAPAPRSVRRHTHGVSAMSTGGPPGSAPRTRTQGGFRHSVVLRNLSPEEG